jgi:NADH-quinone oxidoreductase subunit N
MNPDVFQPASGPLVSQWLNASVPELFLTAAVSFLLLADLGLPAARRGLTHFGALLALLITMVLTLRGMNPDPRAPGVLLFDGMLVRDSLADVMKLGIDLVTFVVLVYAKPSLKERGLFQGEYYSLVLFAVLGMHLLVASGSMVSLYLGLELLALSSYALVALQRDSAQSSEAAMKYFVLGALASGLLLFGMSLIYGASGHLDFDGIQEFAFRGEERLMMLTGLTFVVVGIGFKFGAVPFQMWVPDVYQGAPTAVTLFISSAPKIAAFGMAYRLLEDGLGPMFADWRPMLIVLAVASLAIGNLVAIAQTNLKRMLAYSTIGHVGFLLLGIIDESSEGFGSSLFYALTYAGTSAAAFGLIVLLSRAGFEAEEITDFRGLNQRSSWYAFMMLLVMASFAGVPGLVGFIAKLSVLKAAVNSGHVGLAVFAGVMAVIGAFYYLRVIKTMYFDEPVVAEALPLPADLPFRLVLSTNGIALLVLGVAAAPLLQWCLDAAYR